MPHTNCISREGPVRLVLARLPDEVEAGWCQIAEPSHYLLCRQSAECNSGSAYRGSNPWGQPKLFPSRISHLLSSSTQQSNPSAFPLQCLISERDGTVLDHVALQLLFSDGSDKKYLLD